jgi:hypothetical protein
VKLKKNIFLIVMLSFVMPGIMQVVMKSRYDAIAYTMQFIIINKKSVLLNSERTYD